jgi:hypothetical protein
VLGPSRLALSKGIWICLLLQVWGGRHLLCWVQVTPVNGLNLSKGPNLLRISIPSLEDENRPFSETLCSLVI